MAARDPGAPRGMRWWDRQGLRGGLLAGIGFALVELVAMGIQEGQVEVARFLRRVAAMWIGPAALAPDYPFGIVAVVGTIMHLGFSALFGLIFAWLTESHALRLVRSRGALLAAAAIYGLVLWPLNVYLIAPFVGWEWFAQETEPAVLAAAHLCYGVLLGLYLDRNAGPLSRGLQVLRRAGRLPPSG
jgi:hypothetical protein